MTRPRARVVVLAVTHPSSRGGRLVPEMLDQLRARGCDAVQDDPDQGRHDLSALEPDADLYVLKSGTGTALSYAGALHCRGARILNPYPVAAACRDKVVQTRVLAAAGVPVPRSWVTADPATLADLVDDRPLIIKDPGGSQGRGLHVVHDRAGLLGLGPGPWLVMEYHQPEGPDLKIYRIGEEVFCVERPFPARTYAEKLGHLHHVAPEVEQVVRRCGEAFGIDVYGVDVIRHQGRFWVVDMSAFPGFKGVPAAGRRIADHVVGLLDRTIVRQAVAAP